MKCLHCFSWTIKFAGKRICIGIHLVNSVVPLFLASLLQSFTFSVVPGSKPPTREPEIGVSLSPEEFPVQLTVRDIPPPPKNAS